MTVPEPADKAYVEWVKRELAEADRRSRYFHAHEADEEADASGATKPARP